MPRPKSTTPKLCENRKGYLFARGPDGVQRWFGHKSDPESTQRYAAFLSDVVQGRLTGGKPVEPGDKRLTVAELCLQYVTRELPRFTKAEADCQKCAIRIAREMFGALPVTDFGPLRLRLVRDAMVAGDQNAKPHPRKPWSRGFVNRQVKRLRAVFRWGVSWELVPPSVVDALAAVRSLVPGESSAAETTPRRAVSKADIDAVREKLKQRHRDVFDLMLLTGARPGELLGLTTGMIDRTGEVWRADLAQHKTAHKGKSRTLYFNATAQLILRRYIKADPAAKLFPFGRHTFGGVLKNACARANVPRFVPHQLRHTVVTRLVDELGIEFAQRVAGHATAAMTEHYSRAAEAKAVEAVKRLG
jgi:integrase